MGTMPAVAACSLQLSPGLAGGPRPGLSSPVGGTSPPRLIRVAVSGLVFDAGDVLYDATVWQRWLLRILARIGLRTQYEPFYEVWNREYLDDVCRGRWEMWDAFRAFLRASGLTSGQIGEVLAASQPRWAQFEQSVRPLPGVPATLARLSAMGTRMIVLSHTPESAEQLAQKLTRLGIRRSLQAVVSAADLGSGAPDLLGFRAAAGALGLAPQEVAFVGHCATELNSAARLGMVTIGCNHQPHVPVDVALDRLDQLPSVVTPPARHVQAA
jgi:HAD superfamily hydrolase (TIGR01509 family)